MLKMDCLYCFYFYREGGKEHPIHRYGPLKGVLRNIDVYAMLGCFNHLNCYKSYMDG